LLTLNVNTGPVGDNDPQRSLAILKPTEIATRLPVIMPIPSGAPNPQQFEGLDDAAVTRHRHLYFFRGDFGPDQPCEPDELLHNRRWRDSSAV
jgi:hypothetical protein